VTVCSAATAPPPVGAASVRTIRNGDIIVASDDFRAIYYKPGKLDPQLILKGRPETNDHALLARV
jgi:hypothetical protein